MSDPRPDRLIRAEKLMFNGKIEEALETITNFEKNNELTTEEQLWILILRAYHYFFNKYLYQKAVEIGEHIYMRSQERRIPFLTIDALVLKAWVIFLGIKIDKGLEHLTDAENLLNNLVDSSSPYFLKQKAIILFTKSWGRYFKGDYTKALENALNALEIAEEIEYKLVISLICNLLGYIYLVKSEPNLALKFATKGFEVGKLINHQMSKATSLATLGIIYYYRGDFNSALKSCKQYFSLAVPTSRTEVNILFTMGNVYREKGELETSVKNFQKAVKILEELPFSEQLLVHLAQLGSTYRTKGDYNLAITHLEKSLALSEEVGYKMVLFWSLLWLFFIHLENKNLKQAEGYYARLEKLANEKSYKYFNQGYLLTKAMLLLEKGRSRNRGKAEEILQQITDDDVFDPQIYIITIVTFSNYLLEELNYYNEPEILKELNFLINKLTEIAENQNSSLWIAEGKLLQAKLALLQMDIEEAKSLLTQAQQTAEEYGLNLLAQKISSEHDKLLEKVDEWYNLRKEDAPMAERIEFASFDGVINRLQRKQAVDPPELVDEEPILLLIMDNSGATYFNHPFTTSWDHSDLFSSFMSAFNTFMDEIFSKSIDRIRVGENTILINPMESFLACYVIKGQSYPALQKLTRFTEAIQENSEIWQALNKSVKTSEMLELDKPPALKTVIHEIFAK